MYVHGLHQKPFCAHFSKTIFLHNFSRDSNLLILIFFTSTLLSIPPMVMYIYSWVLVFRFYKELEETAHAMITFAQNDTVCNPRVIRKFMTSEEYALSKNFVGATRSSFIRKVRVAEGIPGMPV